MPSGFAKPGPYVTNLPSDQEASFQSWVRQNHIPFDPSPTSDYDMRGYYKDNVIGNGGIKTKVSSFDGRPHFPDTYKTPYHKTFSNESKYALPNAPHWDRDRLVDSKGNTVADETPKSNLDAIAKKYGGVSSVAGASVDLDAIAKKYGGSSSASSVSPQPTDAFQADTRGPAERWFGDLKHDVQSGSNLTGPGRFLHRIGVQPTHGGGQSDAVGDLFGGILSGPAEIGEGLTSLSGKNNFKKNVQGINEAARGVGHTLALPAAAVAPESVVPTVGAYGPIQAGIEKTASTMGVDPDTSELIGTAGMLLAPGAKKLAGPVGRTIEAHAPTIGKVAGYGGAAFEVAKHPTAQNAVIGVLGSHPAAKIATGAARAVGKGLQSVSDAPLFPHEFSNFDGESDMTPSDLASHVGIDLPKTPDPKLLGPGPTVTPPPVDPVEPMIRTPQSQVVRGAGGRMTKQFLTGETETDEKPRFGARAPNLPNLGDSQAPPPVNPDTAAQPTGEFKNNGIIPAPGRNPSGSNNPMPPVPASQTSPLISTDYLDREVVPSNPATGQQSVTLPTTSESMQAGSDAYKEGQRQGAAKSQPLTNEGISPIINIGDNVAKSPEPAPNVDPNDVLPGDFSLNGPSTFFHGSKTGLDLKDSGLKSNASDDVQKLGYRGNPEDYKGVYLANNPTAADEYSYSHGDIHQVDLPRKSSMRVDPEGSSDYFIHRGDIPPDLIKNVKMDDYFENRWSPPDTTYPHPAGTRETANQMQDASEQRLNTQSDLIDTKGLQQDAREGLDRDQQKAEDLSRKAMYKGSKVGYNPDLPGENGNTDLLPWARTPWEKPTAADEPEPPSTEEPPLPQGIIKTWDGTGATRNATDPISIAMTDRRFGKMPLFVQFDSAGGYDGITGDLETAIISGGDSLGKIVQVNPDGTTEHVDLQHAFPHSDVEFHQSPEEAESQVKELNDLIKTPSQDRRTDTGRRKMINDMSPEELRKELLTSDKTGLPNRRAFDEAQHTGAAGTVGMSDADGLKALNDRFGYEAGDQLLKAKADALREADLDSYHDKGDEFLHRGDSPEDLQSKLDKARDIFRNRVIEVQMKDGTTRQFKGADFSFGTGGDLEQAEAGLKEHKADRETKGERARGELRGITEVGPKPGQADQDSSEVKSDDLIKMPPVNSGSSRILPGDFSTTTPEIFYHGSPSKNGDLSKKGIGFSLPMGIQEGFGEKEAGIGGHHLPDGSEPNDYHGVYMARDPKTASWWAKNDYLKDPGKVYPIQVPSKTFLRRDPEQSALGEPGEHDVMLPNRNVPKSWMKTQPDKDLIKMPPEADQGGTEMSDSNDWNKILSDGLEKAKRGEKNPFAGADEFEGDLLSSAEEYLVGLGEKQDRVETMDPHLLYQEAANKGWNPAEGVQPSLDLIHESFGDEKASDKKPKKKDSIN